jgi:hypothetical protein
MIRDDKFTEEELKQMARGQRKAGKLRHKIEDRWDDRELQRKIDEAWDLDNEEEKGYNKSV